MKKPKLTKEEYERTINGMESVRKLKANKKKYFGYLKHKINKKKTN